MTEQERLSRNGQALELVEGIVGRVELELHRLSQHEKDLHSSRESIEKLSAENVRLRENAESLPKEKRVTRLGANISALSIEEADAAKLVKDIAVSKNRVVALGRSARSAAAELLSGLTTERRAVLRRSLEQLLDLAGLPPGIPVALEFVGRKVIELRVLQYYFSQHSLNDTERQLSQLRTLRAKFDELRAMCESEPSLCLAMPTVAQPVEVPVADLKPAVTNVLGTLVAA
jgi:hypothetical protein